MRRKTERKKYIEMRDEMYQEGERRRIERQKETQGGREKKKEKKKIRGEGKTGELLVHFGMWLLRQTEKL